MKEINLTKFIADNSVYSRRQAEDLIRRGLVSVNGRRANLGEKANFNSKVEVNGEKIISTAERVYIKLNKPRGYTCSNRSFKGEKNIFSLIDVPERLFSVGRLDKDSSGLIILTNDGEMTYELTHPKFEHEKIYLVTLKKDARLKNSGFLLDIESSFKKGLGIGEKTLAKIRAITFLSENEVKIVLSEGKKRQIREMFGIFNLRIESLQRINFAGIGLGLLEEGQWKYLSESEVEKLKK